MRSRRTMLRNDRRSDSACRLSRNAQLSAEGKLWNEQGDSL